MFPLTQSGFLGCGPFTFDVCEDDALVLLDRRLRRSLAKVVVVKQLKFSGLSNKHSLKS